MMLLAEQLTIEPRPARAMDELPGAPLDSNRNPFASGAPGSRLGRPVQTAFGELIRLIGLRTRVVVVLGKPGTGKTVLVSMAARACADMGLSVRCIERGDLLTEAAEDKSDVLFVDEADSMSSSALQSFLAASGAQADRTMVFTCLPSCISRFSFSGMDAAVLELSPLSLLDARLYLAERSNSIGRANLFTTQALDLVIDASHGVPRLLRSIAGLAYFNAAAEGASQIDATHAEAATRMRNELHPAPSAVPHALSALSEPAQTNNGPELPAADPVASIVETNADAAPAQLPAEPQFAFDTEIFVPPETAPDRRALPAAKRIVALSLVLLAGAGVVSLLTSHTAHNKEPQPTSRPAAIAIARPAESPPPQASSEATTPAISASAQTASETASTGSASPAEPSPAQSASAAESAPPQSTPALDSAAAKSPPRTVATTAETEDPNICALMELSRDPRALPVAGRCPEAQRRARLGLPRSAAPGAAAPPPVPRATEIDRVAPPKPAASAIDAAAVAQSTPVEPVRNAASGPAEAQTPIEVPAPPAALRSTLAATPVEKVQTQDPGEPARAPQAPAEQKADSTESGPIPIIIFGYRLW